MVAALEMPSTLEFLGNTLRLNAGDQLTISSDATTWVIGPAACGPGTNVFACVASGAWALRIYSLNQSSLPPNAVTAPYDVWPGTTDNPYAPYIGPNVTVPGSEYCGPMPQCPP